MHVYIVKTHTLDEKEGENIFMSWKNDKIMKYSYFHKKICALKIDDGKGTIVSNPSGLDSRWYVYAVQFCSWICCHEFVHERDHPCMPTNIYKNYEKKYEGENMLFWILELSVIKRHCDI